MNRHRQMLMLGVALIVLSFAVSPASAVRPRHPRRQAWRGNQIPDPTQQKWEFTIVPRTNHVLVKGSRMICFDPMTGPDPYVFDNTLVFRETIDWMIIFMDPLEFDEHPELAVFAKRFGRFTWYDEGNNKVAEGGFRFSEKDQVGYLWAKGDGFVAKGTFYLTDSGMWHEGWYIITDES